MAHSSPDGDPGTVTPPAAKLDVRKSVIMGVIGLALIVLIFWRVIPQIGSYNEAIDSLQSMTWIALGVIAVAVVVYLAVYGLIYKAAEKSLTYWQSQQVKQAAFTISNGVPAGGAVGLALQFGMLTSYRLFASSGHRGDKRRSAVWGTFHKPWASRIPGRPLRSQSPGTGGTPFAWARDPWGLGNPWYRTFWLFPPPRMPLPETLANRGAETRPTPLFFFP
jgi:hypothetical protein